MAAGQRITAAYERKTKLIDEDAVRKDERKQSGRAEKTEVGRDCIQIVISFVSYERVLRLILMSNLSKHFWDGN